MATNIKKTKVLRISKRTRGSEDKEGWFKSAEYKDNDIKEITDPSGGSAKKQITSIPSPFARIDLIKTAFREVVHYASQDIDRLHGDTIYHKMVSDALDIGEIFFNKDSLDKIEIIVWDKNNDLNTLLTSKNPKHKLLGETLKMFIRQDKDAYNFDLLNCIYLLNYDYKTIGGTSPSTLFFSSANNLNFVDIKFGNDKLFDDEYNPLYNRDPEFQKFLYSLFKLYPELNEVRHNVDNDEGRMSEVFYYLEKNLEYLNINNHTLYEEINHLRNNLTYAIFERDFKVLNVGQGSNNPIEVLGNPLRQKKASGRIDSDFIIKSDKYNELKPLVLQNNFKKTGFRYVLHEWQPNTRVPYYDPNPLNSRQLPEQNMVYPYLTVSDFLEDYIIELVYPLNTQKFFDGNFIYETDDKTGCILPIKKAFFEYFDVKDLENTYYDGNKWFEIKRSAGGGITVELRIPIEKKGEHIEFSRTYYPATIENEIPRPDLDNNKGYILKLQFGLVLYPFVKQFDNIHYRAMLIDRDHENPLTRNNKYELNFYANNGESAMPYDLEERKTYIRSRSKKDSDQVETQFYVVNNEFDYIELRNNFSSGIIIPNFKTVSGSDRFAFAVDFGTTNTHIEYLVNDSNKTKSFEIEDDIQIATLHDPTISITKDPLIEGIISHEFIPEKISKAKDIEAQFPHRTVIGWTKGLNLRSASFAFADFNIPFVFEKKLIRLNTDIKTDLKWSNYTDNDPIKSEENKRLVEAFFENILLLIRNKVVLNGGRLEDTSLTWFYPASMLPTRRDELENLWNKLFKEYISTTKSPMKISESTAPFYYYSIEKGVNASDRPVVTIDIGGGTSDIAIFSNQTGRVEIDFITSFKFGANAIFGDGFNSSPSINGFVKRFKNSIETKLSTDKHIDLLQVLSYMLSERPSQDIIAFFFSLENNKNVLKKKTPISFNEMLIDSDDFKIVFVTFYAAIVYHVAKIMKAKNLKEPRYIAFSGTGSKIVNIPDTSNNLIRLSEFTKIIFEEVYEKTNVEKIELQQDPEPKEIAARGGVLKLCEMQKNDNQKEPDSESYKTVLLGTKKDVLITQQHQFQYPGITDAHINEVIAEVKEFINILFKINNRFNYTNNFRVNAARLDDYKNILNEDLGMFLKTGLQLKKQELAGNENVNIEESLFFYPLVGALNKLASSV